MGQLLLRRRGMVPVDYSKEYLTIVSKADNNIITLKYTGSLAKIIDVSTDKVTWSSKTSTADGVTLATLNNGDKLYVRGSNTQYGSSTSNYNTIATTGDFDLQGNTMSLLYGDNFSEQTTLPATYTFFRLFYGCTGLVNTKNLILPATSVGSRGYYLLFSNCSKLNSVPKLPARSIGSYAYYGLFYNTPITKAPELPATSLGTYCYYRMFRNCTGLTKAPVLGVKTLTNYCYQEMFRGCSNLTHVTMLATDISATSCLNNWLQSVAATGTLVKDASMTTLPSGASGIPSGWTTVDA